LSKSSSQNYPNSFLQNTKEPPSSLGSDCAAKSQPMWRDENLPILGGFAFVRNQSRPLPCRDRVQRTLLNPGPMHSIRIWLVLIDRRSPVNREATQNEAKKDRYIQPVTQAHQEMVFPEDEHARLFRRRARRVRFTIRKY
jgi:hypothetical protein